MLHSSQIKQIIIGCTFMFVPILIILMFMGLSSITDGYAGELFSMITAFFCTPLIMETSLGFLGLVTLLGFLALKRRLDGDEFREIEVEIDENL